MYEVKAVSGQYAGQWVVVESIAAGIAEFGPDIDRSTFRPYQAQSVEFVAVGCDVIQVMEDGSEQHVTTAPSQEAAESLAKRFNATHP